MTAQFLRVRDRRWWRRVEGGCFNECGCMVVMA